MEDTSPFPGPNVAGLALIMTRVQDNDVQECRDTCCGAYHDLPVVAKATNNEKQAGVRRPRRR